MKQWTPTAESRLEENLRQRADREGLLGEDAAELRSDLRRHVHEEVEKDEAIESVGLMQLEKLLGRLDAGYEIEPVVAALPTKPQKTWHLWFMGVILPLLVIATEKITGMCGSTFFSPFPTIWHLLLLLLVPAGNWYLLSRMGKSTRNTDRFAAIASGCAVGVSMFYALLFLPMIVPGLMGLVFFLFGILPLSPVLAALASWAVRRRCVAKWGNGFIKTSRVTAVIAFALLVLMEVPGLWTRSHLTDAKSENQLVAAQGLEKLRRWHSEDALLHACYERSWGMGNTDISGWIMHGWADMLTFDKFGLRPQRDPEKARDIYFKVTGRNFNESPPPIEGKAGLVGGSRDFEPEDWDHGGDAVAGRTSNLFLSESRYDGHIDQQSGIAYGEWTMIFHNDSSMPREARCQVRVPAGGKISRLTLWINGEPCEAAFGGVSQVKAAYREVAVVQRRDPVLVNLVGPDTYMVQCFPVPVNGDMKIRLGITSPIDEGYCQLPQIIEENFGSQAGIKHALWLQSHHPFKLLDGDHHSAADGDAQSIAVDSTTMGSVIQCLCKEARAETLWCRDRFAPPLADGSPSILVAKKSSVPQEALTKWIVVVDGSTAMRQHGHITSTRRHSRRNIFCLRSK